MGQDLVIQPAQDLALTGGGLNAMNAQAACSEGCWRLLTGQEGEWRDKVRLIAINPTLRAMMAPVLAAIEEVLVPPDPNEIAIVLAHNAPALGLQPRSDGEWGSMWDSYLAALATMPVACIREGFIRWNRAELYPDTPRRHGFYPSSGELFTLASRALTDLKNAQFRARRAQAYVEKLPPKTKTPEERAAERAWLIEQGHMTPDGKMAPLGAPRSMPGPLRGPKFETPQQKADRWRRLAGDGEPPEEVV